MYGSRQELDSVKDLRIMGDRIIFVFLFCFDKLHLENLMTFSIVYFILFFFCFCFFFDFFCFLFVCSLDCITEHEDFYDIALKKGVLWTSLVGMHDRFGSELPPRDKVPKK